LRYKDNFYLLTYLLIQTEKALNAKGDSKEYQVIRGLINNLE